MKKHWTGLIVLMLAVAVYAGDEARVKVTGDRVSLRAAPEINSVLLDRAMFGDLLTLKDNSEKEWIGVAAPKSVDVWVNSEFVADGAVVPARLNLRSGPSLNHGVVGVVERGDVLTIRGEAGEWLRIAPPEETVVWISRKYAELVGAVRKSVVINVEAAPEPEAVDVTEPVVIVEVVKRPNPKDAVPVIEKPEPVQETVQIVETVVQPEINQMMVAAAEVSKRLVPDPSKEQGVEERFSGVLMPAGGLLSKLVDVEVGEITVCYVRGNAAQMKELEGKALTITGKAYWALDLDMPFIRPVKIQLFSRPE
ncbi:MAG: SH3 domain-containing protein [Kiritimatiellales bacterium]|nr:SH3 domain-containing protein [Kiritimatiellales bacterium]